jgi:glycosyltransferase involved in cell wall biosynthesis
MLVSCLMATRDRRPYIGLAIRCWQQQTHPDRELLIMDDGNDRVADLIPADPRIRYFPRAPYPLSLGQKLNSLAQLAHGEICVNWDDDDWFSDDRIAHQVDTLLTAHVQVCGFSSVYYWDDTTHQCHVWAYRRSKLYACGSSQMYTRHWLLAHPMTDKTLAVDWDFSDHAARHHQLTSEPGLQYLVARYHAHSHWPRDLNRCGMPRVRASQLPPQFFADSGALPAPFTDSPQPPRPQNPPPPPRPASTRPPEFWDELRRRYPNTTGT